jgi:hypothetical protein
MPCVSMSPSSSVPQILPSSAPTPAGYAPYTVAQTGKALPHDDMLQNPLQLERLVERVYELLVEELRNQSERSGQTDFRLKR